MAQPWYEEAPEEEKRPSTAKQKTKKLVPRGGVEVAREVREAEVTREVQETQEVPTPVDSRIAPKFDKFPDNELENHRMKMKTMFLHEQVQSWTK